MSLFEGLILGLIQGLTEFLPVSSSAHLALAQILMGKKESAEILFNTAVLHLASAAAVVVYFRGDLLRLLTDRKRELGWVLLASIPAGAAGLLLKDTFEAAFGDVKLIGACLLVTAVILFLADRVRGEGVPMPEGGLGRAMAVGVAQAFAIFPGISRSGATISGALITGISRPDAFRFSFLLGLPVILGAGGLKIYEGVRDGVRVDALPLAAALVVTFALSLAAIRLLAVLIRIRRFVYFSAYCALLGLAVLLSH